VVEKKNLQNHLRRLRTRRPGVRISPGAPTNQLVSTIIARVHFACGQYVGIARAEKSSVIKATPWTFLGRTLDNRDPVREVENITLAEPRATRSIVNYCGNLDFDPRRRWSEASDLDKGARRGRGPECFLMRAGDVVSICHIDYVNHGSHNMPKFGACRLKCGSDRFNGTGQLHVGVPIEVRRARGSARDEYLISNTNRARVAIGFFEWIPR
jgi:hypothetical protein